MVGVRFCRVGIYPETLLWFIIVMVVFATGPVFFTLNARNVGGAEILIALVLLIFFILAGISYFLGNYAIRMTIAGKEGKPIKVEMSKTKEGNEFYQAVRKQIIIT